MSSTAVVLTTTPTSTQVQTATSWKQVCSKVRSFFACAAYLNLDYQVTDELVASVGVRYTKDDKDFGILVPEPESYLGPYCHYGFATAEYIEDSKSWSDTIMLAVTWTPNDDAMFFTLHRLQVRWLWYLDRRR